MNIAHVVLLLGVTIAVVAIAGHLIAVVLILKHVVNRLNTILGAVEAVTQTARPVDALISDISSELDAGRKTMEDAVARIQETRAPLGTGGDGSARHAPDRQPSGGVGTATAPPPGPESGSEWPSSERPGPPPGPLWDR